MNTARRLSGPATARPSPTTATAAATCGGSTRAWKSQLHPRHSVRLPLSRADAVDPEEALIAALSSCHMLFFLSFAAQAGFVVDEYEDSPVGIMSKNEHGKLFVSKVTLNPAIVFSSSKRPSPEELDALHHRAHEECYIANSVRSEVVVGTRQSAS